MMKARSSIAWPVLVSALFSSAWVTAQDYPAKPVRVVVATPAGLTTDVVARSVFGKLTELSGKPFPVENRFGRAGTVGAARVAQSAPDGYTLLVTSGSLLSTAHVHKDLPYEPLRDLVGITPLAEVVGMLVVHASSPVKTVPDFVALAKKQPGELAYGAGSGSPGHLGAALLASMAGIDTVHVPFRGSSYAMRALLAGETQFMVNSVSSLVAHIKGGNVRPIAVTSARRIGAFPNVPAISEAIPGYELTGWIAAFVPASTPSGIVDELNAKLKRAIEDPQVVADLEARALYPIYMTPAQFAHRLKSDYEKYGRLIGTTGMKPE